MSPLRRVLLLGGGGSGDPFWRPAVNAAINLTNRISLRLGEIAAGISVSQGPWSQQIAVTPAFAVSASAAITAEKPNVNMALALAPRYENRSTLQTPAFDIQRVQIDLTHRKGGVTATATGPGWANATNAQGNNDGTSARCTGAALDPAISTLSLDYSDFVNKTGLTISQVRLIFYSQLSNSAILAPPVRFDYSRNNGGAWTNLLQLTTDYDDIPAGRAFVITPVPTWAELDAFQARMTVDMPALSAVVTLDVDAVELEIVAAETWSL